MRNVYIAGPMSSTMAMWDMVPTVDLSDYLRPRKTREPGTCERCGRSGDKPEPPSEAILFCAVPQARRARAVEGEVEEARRE